MIFVETPLAPVCVIEPDPVLDHGGFFARLWSRREAEEAGLDGDLVEYGISFEPLKGTLRGMHYQTEPHDGACIVRCTMGSIYDVVVDLRPASPTYLKHFSIFLSADNRKLLYVPKGFAHGFLTLDDNAEVLYQMSQPSAPEAVQGVRWNDPAFDICWPGDVRVISERDGGYPDFVPAQRTAKTGKKTSR